ncbi:hypothetical protein J0X14_05155 [Muricauda sp. CAU 1633]|uniref:hypothetical protein n=1 Tax=Allomuricauda sp. CAU 1633 TaxID=2816036 RepID=UPI001A8F7BBD|nr:hypothetical protein [Muricauda sp. CAU 1633]MBO0321673.1 hypothetical protein [Muricauda sp. CAU 1633]
MIKKVMLVVIFAIISCKKDCNECFTPPQPLLFEFVDANTGENLFDNETFMPEQIKVLDITENKLIEHTFTNNQLTLNSFGWETEKIEYNIFISNNIIFSLKVEAERTKESCCDFTRYNQILIQGCDYQLNPESGVYKILVKS